MGIQNDGNSLSPKPVEQQRQAPVSNALVAGVGPGPTQRKQAVQGDVVPIDTYSLNRSTGGTTTRRVPTVPQECGVSTGTRTHQGTLELAGRIGRKSCKILIDSGSTGNYISTQVCTAHGIKIEKDKYPDRLTVADGTTIKTDGKVQIQFKCGGYKGIVQAKVFPGLQKPMSLGIPWLQKENPHIDWTQGTVVVKFRHGWIQLPLSG